MTVFGRDVIHPKTQILTHKVHGVMPNNFDGCAKSVNNLSTNVRCGHYMTKSGLKVVLFNTI
jgi:hypothetical protein